MAWYKAGTCSVTNGSTTVTGTGTAWVGNVRIGSDGFVGPDGLLYEISKVVSATEIILAVAYKGTTAASGRYAVAPIQGYTKELADKAAALIDQFSDAEATAASSASAAASSASAASDSATAAASSASAASASETNAKNSETNAASSASAAASSASAASDSATAAASSASAASASETNAKNSETNAASSAAAAATSETKIAAAVTQAVTQAVADAKLAAHPVGSIYCSVDSANPSSLFGGTWEEVSAGRVLQGADSSHAAGTTAEAGLPNITGKFGWAVSGLFEVADGAFSGIPRDSTNGIFADPGDPTAYKQAQLDASRCSSIYGKSSTVQPPAFFVHIWKRTA